MHTSYPPYGYHALKFNVAAVGIDNTRIPEVFKHL